MRFLFLVLFFCFSHSAFALDKTLLYKESDQNAKNSLYPVSYYLNAVFDVGQNPFFFKQDRIVRDHKEIIKRIRNPHESIKDDGGYGKFFGDEFFGMNALPNIGLHMIGGGYDFRYLYEWYRAKGVSSPLLPTLLTTYAGHIGNEAHEISNDRITSHDQIADLFFYDVIGKLMFSYDPIAIWSRDYLQLRSWSYMPMYDAKNEKVMNAALSYIIRPDVFKSKIRPFFFMGMQLLAGLSYDLNERETVTLAGGVAITDPFEQEKFYSAAFFYDVDDDLSLMFNFNGSENFRYRLNLFPKLFETKTSLKVGSMWAVDREGHPAAGILVNTPFGIGGIF